MAGVAKYKSYTWHKMIKTFIKIKGCTSLLIRTAVDITDIILQSVFFFHIWYFINFTPETANVGIYNFIQVPMPLLPWKVTLL